jgi:bifunctional UDP-N-acetylglucosamine pyrophosphorylase/glucosamine-1-phosphate N-acetyltransferase
MEMPSENSLSIVILAAGEGSRMRSKAAKVLFPICGRPMLSYVLDAALALDPDRIVVVVGHKGDDVVEAIRHTWIPQNPRAAKPGVLEFAWQKEQKGTGHAVMCAKEVLESSSGLMLVLYGDTPLLSGDLLQGFRDYHVAKGASLSLISFTPEDMGAYGRVVRNEQGGVERIVEARDLTPAEAGISEANAGMYITRTGLMFDLLSEVKNDNAKGEYYLTDIVHIAKGRGMQVSAFTAPDAQAVQGVNDRYALSLAEGAVRRDILRKLSLEGVTVRDPSSTYIDFGVEVSPDTVIEPQTYLRGATRIGCGCVIGPGTEIIDSTVGDGSKIWFSVVEESIVGKNVQIGPYSHIRPNATLEEGALVGNFAEVKNTVLGKGTKAHHHCYLGDSTIGAGVNIGAGTVTVNYDGTRKHRTIIEDGAFIGCNANLIAPVTIGKDAYVAAGSTITDDVPPLSLAIARERQVVKEGWVTQRREKGR